jgi:predicted amidohydrolase YtcJ
MWQQGAGDAKQVDKGVSIMSISSAFRSASILPILVTLAACSPGQDSSADLILTNGVVYTVNAAQPWAEAVAVRDGEILYVGDTPGAEALAGEDARRIDLEGKFMLPGFIDSHMHLIEGAGFFNALSLDTFGTVDDWLVAVDDYARANPEMPLIFGYGFLASAFGPDGPHKAQLDKIEADRPILIIDEGFHGAWANSKSLELLNITRDTLDPDPGFSYYKRDASGEATGYLLEGTSYLAMDMLGAVSEDVVIKGAGDILAAMNAFGVTSAFDAGVLQEYIDPVMVLSELEQQGNLNVRMVGSLMMRIPGDVDTAVMRVQDIAQRTGRDKYDYRVLKILYDGTVEGRTAAMFEDYQGEPGNSGATAFSEEQMTLMVTQAAAAGIDVHIHALGERAIHEALNAVEAARSGRPDSPSRYTLCHIQVITDQDLPRFAKLGVTGQSTPLWASFDTEGRKFVSEDQFSRFWRYASLLDSGARLTFGSDFPASGAGTLGMSPLFNIEVGHTRQWAGEPDAPVQPRVSERLDIAALIRGYTLDGAYQLHREDEIGSIEVGKKADFAVLDTNPFDADPYAIASIRVLRTILGGETVYAAGDDQDEK